MKFPPYSFFLLGIFISCSPKRERIEVALQDITESVYASGNVKSRSQYQVYSTVTGLVEKIQVKEGDLVNKGQVIMQLADESTRLQAESARLSAEQAALGANKDKMNELRNSIDLAKAKMQNDSLLFERQQNLWANQIGTRNDLEQRELAYKNSRTAYQSAILRYNDLLTQLTFAARQSQKNLQVSSQMLKEFTIKSETAGKVYSILKEEGEMVSPQLPVAVIGDAGDFILELQVDEYDVALVQIGQKVLVTMDSYRGEVFDAKIESIIPLMNERSRSFRVEAAFVTKPASLYPGLTVEANIVIQTKQNAITIPRNYLVSDSFIIAQDGKKRKVVTGIKDYQRVEIINGLNRGETILKPVE